MYMYIVMSLNFHIFEVECFWENCVNVHCKTSKIINRHGIHVHVYCDKSEFSHFGSEMFLGKLCECTL